MASCANGHVLPAGAGSCAVCGSDAQARCGLGHVSPAGARWCQACGQPLLDELRSPAPGVLEYTTGSFAEYIAASERAAGAPAEVPAVVAAGGTLTSGEPPTDPGTGLTAHAAMPRPVPPAGNAAGPARRARLFALAAGVLAVAVLTGAFILLGQHSSHGRSAASRPAAGPPPRTGPASPAAPGGVPRWGAPILIDQQARRSSQQGGSVTVSGLACPAASRCFAVDTAGNVLAGSPAGNWQLVDTDPRSGLTGISCGSPSSCLALDSSGYVLILNRGSWQAPVYVDARAGTFTGVSCPAPAFCMAVDSGGNAFAYHGPGAGWTPFSVDTTGAGLTAVSCPSAGDCVAAGRNGDIYAYNGTSWARTSADPGQQLTAISCASPAFCTATDTSGKAAIFAGGRWSVSGMGDIAAAVACPAAGYCVAVDGAGGAVTYQRGGWSPVTRAAVRAGLRLLSCASAGTCLAADGNGNGLPYAPPAGG